MQARDAAPEDRKPRARDFVRGIKIEQLQPLAHVHVILHLEIEGAQLAHAAQFNILVGRFAHRHAGLRQIGYHHQKIIQTLLQAVELRFQRLQLIGLGTYLGHQGRGIFLFRFQLTDLFGQRIAARLQILGVCLHFLAFSFERLEGGFEHDRSIARRARAAVDADNFH